MKSGRWLFITSVVTILALFGCKSAGVDGELFPEEPGSLTITIDEQVSRSILPDISMDPASYLVAGVGPGTAAFSDVITGTSLTKSNLAFGTWTVTVTARNATPTAIGSGTGNTTVISNSSVTLPITVVPYSGNGTLNLSLSWTAADVQTAGVVSTLTPLGGTSAPLTFTVNGAAGTASFSAADVAAGYYTLSVKLQDNGATRSEERRVGKHCR